MYCILFVNGIALVVLVDIYCKNLYYSGTFAVVLTSALTPSPEDGGREEGQELYQSDLNSPPVWTGLDWTGLGRSSNIK